ncbi:MAG: hypothetical protein A3K14_03320 [Sulfurimonas sp. RIFCSPLOWO2_12_FULL_36_74]|uniref:calcium-binding protein n=1 Tax=Sulfurimonas sp. RIFCSPLOWO2_12_36_12 TaxID=1802253 RepID=UPI0008C1A6B6|nr:calcium-binding protein [Sulfurimonas sp. RIFCSPLOWO2_12_36_12]OHD98880.1 MAG: hypothetical protein A3J26_05590 [Sulfurimonas sp. RIFCSPLOWO2_02_FULL_36_28]OHE02339.1 MAG: hypothetical protein A2W82_09585 [Sulfurimonas sp. RIFCSPLOWO2_12_36_12]OHE06280.1 MAG: hypothetical protein A3K14_03320 [Sulfurimonas sp. RIFCSPLOWO2_12_FULL_36_74]
MQEQSKNHTVQTTEIPVETKDILQYDNKKVVVKKAPSSGQNVAVYVRPGDDVVYDMKDINLDSLDYRLIGGDIVVTMPNGGVFTFVSMALMGYGDNPPSFLATGSQVLTLGEILSEVKEVNDLPFNSIAVEADIQQEDKVKKIVEELEETVKKLSKEAAKQESYIDPFSGMHDYKESQKHSYEEISSGTIIQDPTPVVVENYFTSFNTGQYTQKGGNLPPFGAVEDAAKPVFYFKVTAHQTPYEEIINDDGQVEILGGDGSINGYEFASITNQFEPETIDMSQRSEDMIIRAEGSSSLSRVLRFEPQMPEGFYVDSFVLSGLPVGVTILDKDGNPISGSTITKEQMVFKDALGNEISYDSENFITNFKSVEFVIEYTNDISSEFNVAITANYKLDTAYIGTTDIGSNQSYTNEYTFALKDITSAGDYTYNKTDFTDAEDEGFILSKETNYNIIKDGSGNSTIYGGIVKDVVYDGAGDDTVYLNAGDDTLYGGSGTNYIYGDTDGVDAQKYAGNDTLSYESVKSFEISEVKLLEAEGLISVDESAKLSGTYVLLDGGGNPIANSLDIDMLASYKGIYVDLDGVHVDGLGIDVNQDGVIDTDDKINAISKFANRDGQFDYDENGNAITTTLTEVGLENLQTIGYDVLEDIENIIASNYNDTIYGNALADNILSGLGGSDTLDGRGGNNTLLGGDGYDTLFAGSGNDFIDGGADTDTLSYANASQGMIIRFDRPNSEEFDYAGYDDGSFDIKDTIINVEDIRGSNFADTIYGNGSTNFIESGSGDDRIFAGGGYDFIDGGAGSDWITYNPADYTYNALNPSFMQQIQGITVDLNSTDFVMVKETTTSRLIDLIKSVEQIRATSGSDFIYGSNYAEIFWGLDGNDRLESRGGNDTLYGGDGNDYIRSGAGLDISWGGNGVDYLELYDDGLTANQTLQITEAGTIQYWNGASWIDGYNGNGGVNLAYEFEGLGASNGIDTIYGNSQANVLNGYYGNDTIYGMAGNDVIDGGNDNDTIYGDDVANLLSGNDSITGGNGNDTMYGGKGDDTFYGSIKYDAASDKDAYHGGEGIDTLDYSRTNHNYAMTVNMTGGGDGSITFSTLADGSYLDTFTGIERIIGSRGNDTMTADSSGMYFDGWSGTDKLYGGAGADTIIARNTSGEILDGNGGVDTLKLVQNVNLRAMTISDLEILDIGSYTSYLNISQFTQFSSITGSGSFYLYGTTGNDTFDFSTIDLSNFTGKLYLDASSGTDTLKLGTNQTINMTDNYYNTFETFNLDATSTLNVQALNNSGRSFYANNKNFTDVNGEINFIGGTGNDIFYVDYTALNAGKLNIDGGAGSDLVDIRTTLANSTLTFNDADMFSNIERLEFDQIVSTNIMKIDADVLDDWFSSTTFTLDLVNNAQGSRVTISDTDNGDMTNFTIGSHSLTQANDPALTFSMTVV